MPDTHTGNAELGQSIRRLRLALRKTLANIAEGAGISVQYLSDVERGRRLPSLDVLDRIARALDTLATAILDGVYPYGRHDDLLPSDKASQTAQ